MSDQKAKGKPGRPTRKTPEIVDILLKCLSWGLHIQTACAYAKIDRKTFYNWLESDDDFSTQVEFAQSQAIISLAQEVRSHDPQGPWKLLKNVAPDRYKDKIEQEVTGKDGEPLKLEVYDYRSKTPVESDD